jgi:hypothetical protein
MKPIDFRDATWAHLQERVCGMRLRTLHALQQHGPCTTRALAAACEADVLAIRPRVTELIQLGLVQLVPGDKRGHQGVYRALEAGEAQELFAARRDTARALPVQTELPLSGSGCRATVPVARHGACHVAKRQPTPRRSPKHDAHRARTPNARQPGRSPYSRTNP